MIDTSVIRVHQHRACTATNAGQNMGRSRGRLTSKIHVAVDANGLRVLSGPISGPAHDNTLGSTLIGNPPKGGRLLADRGCGVD